METIPEETQENRSDKIIHLQNSIRKYLARKNFLWKRNAAVTIQKNYKSRRIYFLYQRILSAIMFIQNAFRVYKNCK